MGITNFAWETDVSGLPKAAAGCGLRSRDMLKWGMLILAHGKWQGEQLIPASFVQRATSPITLSYGTSYYGYFWWVDDFTVAGKTYHGIEGRGAGGQFIFMFPELDLVAVITAHHKGMGDMLATAPNRIVPMFIAKRANDGRQEKMMVNSSVLIGWAIALFLINEVVAQFIAWLNRRGAVRGWAVHGWLALPALAVVMAPAVADFGSGSWSLRWPALVRSAVAVLCTMASQAALWAEVFLLTGLVLDGMRARARSQHGRRQQQERHAEGGGFQRHCDGTAPVDRQPGVDEARAGGVSACPLLVASGGRCAFTAALQDDHRIV